MDKTPPQIDEQTRTALHSLADITLPPPVPWWPQTWGWAVLALFLLALAALALWRWLHHRRVNRYRREALAELALLERQIDRPEQRSAAVRALPELLKRVALAAWPRGEVASLTGERWVEFLKDNAGGAPVPAELVTLLKQGEYASGKSLIDVTEHQLVALTQAARGWIEGHRVSA
ncbi:DUF4381 domain-containing protein [Mesorhizobium sp. BAC0120]|uniref:DUF4381 domain-containing protein n=1 Tax=Mesorhizobium sp. BAC0120 TaxID=3090670 RepID=UPI00298C3582|nr:DUF4381 domain-containing protein [Mesorhizobium sp. BAC0120]MDW6022885.1 DUF4381 domain-containing protein [Mesorhizobium sp. BAC0120]